MPEVTGRKPASESTHHLIEKANSDEQREGPDEDLQRAEALVLKRERHKHVKRGEQHAGPQLCTGMVGVERS